MWDILQTLVDIDLFMDIKRIEEALGRHSCTEALAWCSENKNALRKLKVCTPSTHSLFVSSNVVPFCIEYSRV